MCDDHVTVNITVSAKGFVDHNVIVGLIPEDCPELELPAPERAGTSHEQHAEHLTMMGEDHAHPE